MRRLLKSALVGTPLENPARGLQNRFRSFRREMVGIDRKVTAHYLSTQKPAKLHLGCGSHVLDGWLNADVFPISEQIVRTDATRQFPFADGSFDHVFSEHMIEHIPYADGQHMLNECFRVLKNNGTVRISTPDLAFLIDLYRRDKSEQQTSYIKWASEAMKSRIPYAEDTYVINNFVRDFGHQFIYDEKVLRATLERAGFKNVVRCRLNESEQAVFRHLENEAKMPAGFLVLESISMEGTKTGSGPAA